MILVNLTLSEFQDICNCSESRYAQEVTQTESVRTAEDLSLLTNRLAVGDVYLLRVTKEFYREAEIKYITECGRYCKCTDEKEQFYWISSETLTAKTVCFLQTRRKPTDESKSMNVQDKVRTGTKMIMAGWVADRTDTAEGFFFTWYYSFEKKEPSFQGEPNVTFPPQAAIDAYNNSVPLHA